MARSGLRPTRRSSSCTARRVTRASTTAPTRCTAWWSRAACCAIRSAPPRGRERARGSALQAAFELFGAPRRGEGRLTGDASAADEIDEGSFEGDHALVLAELNLFSPPEAARGSR